MSKLKTILLFLVFFPSLLLAHSGDGRELIIRMTENGFEPKELTVEVGAEVLFINNDEISRWPASNFHPTHELYAEFDPKEGIAPGDSWKFTFDKAGTWKLHDHLLPHLTGTIVVVGDGAHHEETDWITDDHDHESYTVRFINSIVSLWRKLVPEKSQGFSTASLEEFSQLSDDEKYTWLQRIAQRDGSAVAWQYVLKNYETPDGIVGNAHDMAHLVGQLIYKEKGLEGLNVCTASFAFGCYHGLMEIAFEKVSADKYQAKILEAEESCLTLGGAISSAAWSCIHGIGHGVVSHKSHDLIESLLDCELLDERVKHYCNDGVFMELSSSAPPSFYDSEDPLYPCTALPEEYHSSCTRSQVRVMGNKFGLSLNEIAKTCVESKSDQIIYHCIDSLGYGIGQRYPEDHDKIIAECEMVGEKKYVAQCSAAAAGELVFQNSRGWQENAYHICEHLIDTEHVKSCNERVESVKTQYGRE